MISFPGAADGGVFNSPTMISEYGQLEAAVPLTNPSRARDVMDQIESILPSTTSSDTSNIAIHLSIDPNIPLDSNFAGRMGAALGDRVITALHAKGIRR